MPCHRLRHRLPDWGCAGVNVGSLVNGAANLLHATVTYAIDAAYGTPSTCLLKLAGSAAAHAQNAAKDLMPEPHPSP